MIGCLKIRSIADVTAWPDDESGFTLIEVLVALAVLGISLTILLAVFSQALDQTRQAQRQLAATNIAKSLLLQAETIPASGLHANAGTTADGFEWRIQVSPFGSDSDRNNWPSSATTISTTVQWKDRGRDRSVSLTTLRLVPKDNGQ